MKAAALTKAEQDRRLDAAARARHHGPMPFSAEVTALHLDGEIAPVTEPDEISPVRPLDVAAVAKPLGDAGDANVSAGATAERERQPEYPPVDTWLCDERGLFRWRPVTDRIDVIPLPNGERLLVLTSGLRLKLSEPVAQHLGKLLMGGAS